MSEFRKTTMSLVTSGGELVVRRATVRQALSEPTEATVEVHSDATDPGFAGAADEEVELRLLRMGVPVRSIKLRLRSVRHIGRHDVRNAFELDLRSSFWFLKLTKNIRKFRDLNSKDIVSKVLAGKVDASFELTRDPWSLPYVVQYRESDFDFVSRLLEFDGIYYEATDDDKLTMHDASSAAPPFGDGSPHALVGAAGALHHGDEAIFALSKATRVGSGRATVNDYHWKTPSLDLLESEKGKRDELLEVYDYPSGYRKPDQGKTLAKLRIEAFEATKRVVRGESSFAMLAPGKSISIAHADGVSFSGDYFITQVTHLYEDVDGEGVSRNRFEAIPLGTPYRPKPITPKPEIGGYDTAMVRGPVGEEIYTDKFGRAKVQFHWDREAEGTDKDSRWIRVLQETSSSMTLARIGWEVAVAYIDSDPDRPVAVARMINGQMVPTYGQPSNQNVLTIRTETYPGKAGFNEIRIDDTAGAQQIYIHAEKDHDIHVKHDKREWVGNNETVTVGSSVSREVHKTQTVDIGHDVVRNVGGDESFKVETDRTEKIGGSETVKVTDTIALAVMSHDVEKVGSLRLTIAGGIQPPKPPDPLGGLAKPDPKALLGQATSDPQAALSNPGGTLATAGASLKASIPTPDSIKSSLTNAMKPPSLESLLQGTISRSVGATFKRMVGGAFIALAGEGITLSTTKLLAEVVGGLRLTIATRETLNTNSTGKFIRLVGGMISRKAGKDITASAKDSVITIGGNATFTAPDKVELRGQEIKITALTKVVLEQAGLSIVMTPAKIVINGDLKLKAKDKIKVEGTPDNVTK
jgi:type VI secretion system secreted protein VgrG